MKNFAVVYNGYNNVSKYIGSLSDYKCNEMSSDPILMSEEDANALLEELDNYVRKEEFADCTDKDAALQSYFNSEWGFQIEVLDVDDEPDFYHYKTQARETGTLIDLFYIKEHAEMAVAEYEKQDKGNGTYTPDFYEVKELDVEEYTRYRIGMKITAIRKAAGLTQLQLAEKCGMAQPNIARIENGTYATSIDVLSRIAEALGKRIELV